MQKNRPACHACALCRVSNVALNSNEFTYALSAMRGGYFYVFYEKGPAGTRYWDLYVVNHDGTLLQIMQRNIAVGGSWIATPQPQMVCSTSSHQAHRPTYFVIEEPEKCDTVWFAFSEHPWRGQFRER
jgi:hypothetical protein